jgi:hypothetical protein
MNRNHYTEHTESLFTGRVPNCPNVGCEIGVIHESHLPSRKALFLCLSEHTPRGSFHTCLPLAKGINQNSVISASSQNSFMAGIGLKVRASVTHNTRDRDE